MVAGMTSVQRKKLIAEGITTIDALAELRRTWPRGHGAACATRPGCRPAVRIRTAPAPSSRTASTHTVTYKVLRGQRAGQHPRAQRRRHLLRLRGRSALAGSRHRPVGAGVPLRRDRGAAARRSARCQEPVFRPFWAHSRSGETAGLPGLPRLRGGTPGQVSGHARLPLRPLRKDGASRNLSLTPRRRRRHRGQLASRRGARGSLRHGPALTQDLRGLLLHQETRAAVHGRQPAVRRRQGRRGLRGGLRRLLRCARRRTRNAGEAAAILASISDYNEYDCLSTLRLRDWLLRLRLRARAAYSAAPPAATRRSCRPLGARTPRPAQPAVPPDRKCSTRNPPPRRRACVRILEPSRTPGS